MGVGLSFLICTKIPFVDVFFDVVVAETVGFVDKLFECLTTKIYLGNTAPKEAPKEEVQAPAVKTEGEEGPMVCILIQTRTKYILKVFTV